MSQAFGLGMSEELNVNRFVFSTAVISNFSKILTMKLLDLQGCHFTRPRRLPTMMMRPQGRFERQADLVKSAVIAVIMI